MNAASREEEEPDGKCFIRILFLNIFLELFDLRSFFHNSNTGDKTDYCTRDCKQLLEFLFLMKDNGSCQPQYSQMSYWFLFSVYHKNMLPEGKVLCSG